jgi:hypothetical protein
MEALEHWKKARGEEHPDVANAWLNLAVVWKARKLNDRAMEGYAKALSIRQKALGEGHPLTALVHVEMAGVLAAQGKPEEARLHLAKAIPVLESVYGKAAPPAAPEPKVGEQSGLRPLMKGNVVGQWASDDDEKIPLAFLKDGTANAGFIKQDGKWLIASGTYTVSDTGRVQCQAKYEGSTLFKSSTPKDDILVRSHGPRPPVRWVKVKEDNGGRRVAAPGPLTVALHGLGGRDALQPTKFPPEWKTTGDFASVVSPGHNDLPHAAGLGLRDGDGVDLQKRPKRGDQLPGRSSDSRRDATFARLPLAPRPAASKALLACRSTGSVGKTRWTFATSSRSSKNRRDACPKGSSTVCRPKPSGNTPAPHAPWQRCRKSFLIA